jgi:hypothetical protein
MLAVAGMWVDKRGNFHFLMHYIPDNVLVARHAFARDYTGPWAMHETTIPYNSTVQFMGGGSGKCSNTCVSVLAVRNQPMITCDKLYSRQICLCKHGCIVLGCCAVTYEKRERPHIVFDDKMDPTWLVTGAVLPTGQHGYSGKSFTLVQQIDSRQ